MQIGEEGMVGEFAGLFAGLLGGFAVIRICAGIGDTWVGTFG